MTLVCRITAIYSDGFSDLSTTTTSISSFRRRPAADEYPSVARLGRTASVFLNRFPHKYAGLQTNAHHAIRRTTGTPFGKFGSRRKNVLGLQNKKRDFRLLRSSAN